MNSRSLLRSAALGGAVVATLCFFPLLNGLASEPAWLHWTTFDSVESMATWLVTAAIVALTLWFSARVGGRTWGDVVGTAWLLSGGVFVVGGVVKIDAVMGYVGAYRSSGPWVIGALAVAVAAIAAIAVVHPGAGDATRVQRFTQFLWPLILLLLFHFIRAPALAASQQRVLSPGPASLSMSPAAVIRHTASSGGGLRTVILLFDELSPDYLFGDRAVDLSARPALHRLVTDGRIYRDAHLPGGSTRHAIPALFGATAAAPQGLVEAVRDQGRSVRVLGWYHDYCAGMAKAAEACHSNSIYNARTLHDGVSLLDPWWTNLNLLPADLPFSVLKDRTAIALHRRTLEATRDWLSAELADPQADLIYAHVNVPHLPLLTDHLDTLRDPRPFTMSEEGYVRQFDAVDSVVSLVLASHLRPTQLIVLSDHNARPLSPKSQHEHVVLVTLRAGMHEPDVISRVEAAETVARLSLTPDSP